MLTDAANHLFYCITTMDLSVSANAKQRTNGYPVSLCICLGLLSKGLWGLWEGRERRGGGWHNAVISCCLQQGTLAQHNTHLPPFITCLYKRKPHQFSTHTPIGSGGVKVVTSRHFLSMKLFFSVYITLKQCLCPILLCYQWRLLLVCLFKKWMHATFKKQAKSFKDD